MQAYESKKTLIDEINKTYDLFIKEFEDVNDKDFYKRIDGIDRNPAEMIAYQIGWINHILEWEKDELAGKEVITPAPNLKWTELGKLYQVFYEKYAKGSKEELLSEFAEIKDKFIKWIDSLDDKILFELDMRKWAYIKAGWPVWKWVHINTVAPFKSFRSQIRKWKKQLNEA